MDLKSTIFFETIVVRKRGVEADLFSLTEAV